LFQQFRNVALCIQSAGGSHWRKAFLKKTSRLKVLRSTPAMATHSHLLQRSGYPLSEVEPGTKWLMHLAQQPFARHQEFLPMP
jgi:hypothetical protein